MNPAPPASGYLGTLTDPEAAALKSILSQVATAVVEAGHEAHETVTLWGQQIHPAPEGAEPTDARDIALLKFLRAREFDVEQSYKMFVACLKWRLEAKIDSIISMELPSEFLGHDSPPQFLDRNNRPVVITTFGTMNSEKAFGDIDAFVRYRVKILERAISHLSFKRGEAETLAQIHDYTGVPLVFQDAGVKKAVKAVTQVFSNCYPEFKGVTVFANFPTPFVLLFKAFSVFIPAKTREKFQLVNAGDTPTRLTEIVRPGALDPRFGGLRTELSSSLAPTGEVQALGTRESLEVKPLRGLTAGDKFVWQARAVYGSTFVKVAFRPTTDTPDIVLFDSGAKEIDPNGEGIVKEGRYECKVSGDFVMTLNNVGMFTSKVVAYRAEKVE